MDRGYLVGSRLPCYVFCICQLQISWVGRSTTYLVATFDGTYTSQVDLPGHRIDSLLISTLIQPPQGEVTFVSNIQRKFHHPPWEPDEVKTGNHVYPVLMVKFVAVFVLAFLLSVCVSKVASSTTRESDENRRPRVPSVGGEICCSIFWPLSTVCVSKVASTPWESGENVYTVLMVKLAVVFVLAFLLCVCFKSCIIHHKRVWWKATCTQCWWWNLLFYFFARERVWWKQAATCTQFWWWNLLLQFLEILASSVTVEYDTHLNHFTWEPSEEKQLSSRERFSSFEEENWYLWKQAQPNKLWHHKHQKWAVWNEWYGFETDAGGALLHKDRRVVGQGGKLTIYLGFFNIDCFGCYNIHNTKVTFITATQGGTSWH